jgi:hypothetical protein
MGGKTMAGFFLLELDTTGPDIVVNAPNYTTKDTPIDIIVSADETLSDGFQDFYVIDQYGVRHNCILSYDEKEYTGRITLSTFDNGIVTFYARVKDEVGNLSALGSKAIQIIPSVNYLRLDIDDTISIAEFGLANNIKGIETSITNFNNNISMSIEKRALALSSGSRKQDTSSQTRNTQTKTEVVTK